MRELRGKNKKRFQAPIDPQKRRTAIAVLLSLLFHVVLFLLYQLLAPSLNTAQAEVAQPITLEFEQPAPTPRPKEPVPLPEKFYRVVENKQANEQVTEQETDLLSTKNSRAAAPELMEKPLAPRPRISPGHVSESPAEPAQEVPVSEGSVPVFAFKQKRVFDRSALTREPLSSPEQQPEPEPSEASAPSLQSLEDFRAEMVGDFAMSTYAWKWAPYWMAFEEKLHRVWYVPRAYDLGLISGYTIVWMKINRKGELVGFKVLKHEGHHTLQESSVNAIQSCFPFKELPPDFPDKFLEVRLLMVYPDVRQRQTARGK